MVDEKMFKNSGDGFRQAELPPMREAWRLGLAAIDAEAMVCHRRCFEELELLKQDAILTVIQKGEVCAREWEALPPKSFFKHRVLHDREVKVVSEPDALLAALTGQSYRFKRIGLEAGRRNGCSARLVKPACLFGLTCAKYQSGEIDRSGRICAAATR
jgi:hypothetical protein